MSYVFLIIYSTPVDYLLLYILRAHAFKRNTEDERYFQSLQVAFAKVSHSFQTR
jgi:hypothetical protein